MVYIHHYRLRSFVVEPLRLHGGKGPVHIDVRAYGGWFTGSVSTSARAQAATRYADVCPSVIRLENTYMKFRFSFADQLLTPALASPPKITHTIVVRDREQHLAPKEVVCNESGCELSTLKRWVRKRRACPAQGCPNSFSDAFRRTEQKQVDVHLATDLLLLFTEPRDYDHVIVASDDIDFMPAALAAVASAKARALTAPWLTLVRNKRKSSYADWQLQDFGATITQLQDNDSAMEGE